MSIQQYINLKIKRLSKGEIMECSYSDCGEDVDEETGVILIDKGEDKKLYFCNMDCLKEYCEEDLI